MPLGIRLKKSKTAVTHRSLAAESIENLSTAPETKLRAAIDLQRKKIAEGKKENEAFERRLSPLYQQRNELQQKIDTIKAKLENPDVISGSEQLNLEVDLALLRDQADDVEMQIDKTIQELHKQ